MRFATYNIHGCVGTDARFDPHRIARVLQALDADVIALQEVEASRFGGDDVLAFLASRTGMTAFAGMTLKRGDADYGNALLTRLPVDAMERIDLSIEGCEPRGLIDVRLRHRHGPVQVLATHLGLRAAERRAQLDLLLAQLGRDPAPSTVLLGDFNEWWSWSDTLRRLRAHFPYCYAPPTFPTRCPLLCLDRIWLSSRNRPQRVGREYGQTARKASDHLPAWIELDW